MESDNQGVYTGDVGLRAGRSSQADTSMISHQLAVSTCTVWGFPKWLTGGSCLPMQETRVQSLDGEYPLEKEMATHSSILAGKSHGQRSLVGYRPRGHKESVTKQQKQNL